MNRKPFAGMPFDEARRAKWERGRALHRGGGETGFVGDPAYELFEEMLDAMNYLEELESRGVDVPDEHREAVRALAGWAADVGRGDA